MHWYVNETDNRRECKDLSFIVALCFSFLFFCWNSDNPLSKTNSCYVQILNKQTIEKSIDLVRAGLSQEAKTDSCLYRRNVVFDSPSSVNFQHAKY